MALNSRTAPQKSFGRRAGTAPLVHRPEAPVPVEKILQDAQPAPNWLREMVGQSIADARYASRPEDDPSTDGWAPSLPAGDIVGRSLAVLGRNPMTFLAVLAAIALPEQFIAYFPISMGMPATLVTPLFTTLGCMALYAASFHGALASLRGEKVNLDTCLRAMARTPGSAYGTLAATVSSLSLMLIVPAIAFAGRWFLAAPVALVEGRDARARSVALTAPHRAQVRLLVLLLAGLTLLRGLLAVALTSNRIVGALTGDWLFPMLLTMFAAVAGAVLYRTLVPSAPPAPQDDLAD